MACVMAVLVSASDERGGVSLVCPGVPPDGVRSSLRELMRSLWHVFTLRLKCYHLLAQSIPLLCLSAKPRDACG
jgi:hypothetical protein